MDMFSLWPPGQHVSVSEHLWTGTGTGATGRTDARTELDSWTPFVCSVRPLTSLAPTVGRGVVLVVGVHTDSV